MTRTLLLRLCIVALAVLVIMGVWELLKDSNDGMKFVFVVAVGVLGGIFVVKYVIPWVGDLIGESVYPYPLSEIAKIYSEKLNNPDQALLFLQGHLEAKEWPVDDAAFIMFRMIEVHADVKKDYQMAHDLLEEVIANFPNTRHSANAHHRLHEVEQAEYQLIMAERAKEAAQI